MDDHIPRDVLDAMRRGAGPRGKGPRFFVSQGDRTYPLTRLTESGFTLAAAPGPRLRGYVDLLAGEERFARALVVYAEEDAGLVRYEFKNQTREGAAPRADYAAPEAPPGLAPPD